MVFADSRCDFVQEVATDVANAGMNLLDAGLCLLSVVTELDLSAQGYCIQPREQPQGGVGGKSRLISPSFRSGI